MILFRQSDTAIFKSDWYKEYSGLKAEAVTYTLALLRFSLKKERKDINLERIYNNQSISGSLERKIVALAEEVRNNIDNADFRGGSANPSEFCKSERGWNRVQKMEVDLSDLDIKDILNTDQISDVKAERSNINDDAKSISNLDYVMNVSAVEWAAIKEFNQKTYPYTHHNVGIPVKCIELHKFGKLPTDKQLKMAVDIRKKVYLGDFDFAS